MAHADFPLEEEHEMIRSAVREFVTGELAPRARELDETASFPVEIFAEYAENGMLGIPFPEEYGGGDGDALGFLLSVIEVARACGSTAVTLVEHVGFAAWPLYRLGTKAQCEAWLEAMLSGEGLGSLAHNERRVGESLSHLRTHAAAQGNDAFALTGEKSFVLNAGRPGPMLVSAHTGSEPRRDSVHLFVLSKQGEADANVRMGERYETMGVRAADVRDITFDAANVTRDGWLGEAPVAAAQLEEALALGQLGLTAVAIGLVESALAESAEYAQARRQFDQPIGDFPAIRFRIAEMQLGLDASKALLFEGARRIAAGEPVAPLAASARITAAQVAEKATYDAIQVYGGNGYSREYPLQRYWRDAKVISLVHGSLEAQRFRLAAHAMPEQ